MPLTPWTSGFSCPVQGQPGHYYAGWGVDFVKIDDLPEPYQAGEIELIRKAIDRTGRKIVFSMSPGETPLADARHAQQPTRGTPWATFGTARSS